MEVTMSKKIIKKCCEIIEGSGYSFKPLSLKGNYGCIRYGICVLTKSDHPFYRDFLQLVIEEIEKRDELFFKISWQGEKIGTYYAGIYDCPSLNPDYIIRAFTGKTIIEAKEKAITFALNMVEDK